MGGRRRRRLRGKLGPDLVPHRGPPGHGPGRVPRTDRPVLLYNAKIRARPARRRDLLQLHSRVAHSYGLVDRDVVLSALRLHLRPSVSLARRLPVLGAARDEAFRREVPAPRDQGPRAHPHGALGRRVVAVRTLFSSTGASSSAPYPSAIPELE